MKERADFHVHFGDRTTCDLIDEALTNNVRVMGVLDRGIVRTCLLRQLTLEAKQKNITIIPGVECLTEVDLGPKKISIELLGLDFDLEHPQIYHNFDPNGEVYSQKHLRKVEFQKDFLEQKGFSLKINPENCAQWDLINNGTTLDTAIRLCKIVASNQENTSQFDEFQQEIENHLNKRPQDKNDLHAKFLYWKYFAPGQSGFRRWQLDYQTIIDSIHQAQGVVIVPHPSFRHKPNGTDFVTLINSLFEIGIDGIEGWDADLLDKSLIRSLINKGKIIVGGSGRDATYYSNRIIGKGDIEKQRMFISPRRLQDIRNYKQKVGLAS